MNKNKAFWITQNEGILKRMT